GNDVLIGGTGADHLFGQDGDDLLVGGTTGLDNSNAALQAVLAEWSSNQTFNVRIANLAIFMNAGTVADDGVKDELNGGAGRDWFLDFSLDDSIVGFLNHPTKGDRLN